jgi:hypothetical protein
MPDPAAEKAFQDEIIAHLTSHGWQLGESAHYDRERALYPKDVIGFVQDTQPESWEKLAKQYPKDPEGALINAVTRQLAKADPAPPRRHPAPLAIRPADVAGTAPVPCQHHQGGRDGLSDTSWCHPAKEYRGGAARPTPGRAGCGKLFLAVGRHATQNLQIPSFHLDPARHAPPDSPQ